MSENETKISRRHLLLGRKFCKDEEGATAIEYGLIAALISVALILGAGRLGRQINIKFIRARNSVRDAKENKG